MNKSGHCFALLVLICMGITNVFGQNVNRAFKLESKAFQIIEINKNYSSTVEISPFGNKVNKIYGLAASMDIELASTKSMVRLVLVDDRFNEYLIYESHALVESSLSVSRDAICEETCILDGVKVKFIRIEIQDAEVTLKSLTFNTRSDFGGDLARWRKEQKQKQNAYKIEQINKNLKAKGKHWVAGPTSVSELSFAERKKLYGQSTFPPGFEFYVGGIISATGTDTGNIDDGSLKSATGSSSPYVDNWDWRDRHGRNWVTEVKDQEGCGSCWAFVSTGATESATNLYFNRQLNLDLSEQQILSCSGAGDCGGGNPGLALDYISGSGIIDESTFPYASTDLPCTDQGQISNERIKITGKINFGTEAYPKEEDVLKKMLIKTGPVNAGLYSWSHGMVLVGYKVVESGETLYISQGKFNYWMTVAEGDPLIGKTVWLFKNSWGSDFGDAGYVYVETEISDFGWTHGIQTPITSHVQNYEVVCEDRDGDGYYWWGLGEKPAHCPECPDLADGDDSDPTLGPLDEYGYCIPLNGTPAPVASFSADKTSIMNGESVVFTDASVNNPTSWTWTFEGGTPATSNQQNPEVSYSSAGAYNVSLQVSNANGSDTRVMADYIVVKELNPPVAAFSSDETTIEVDSLVAFSDLSTNNPQTWSWKFPGASPATSTQQNPVVSYGASGKFDVELIVSNSDGSDTLVAQQYITVSEPVVSEPVADFSSDKTNVKEGEKVGFADKSQNNPTSRRWDFEGGNPAFSEELNPSVTYAAPGSYKVSLTVSNAGGANTKTIENYIQVESNELTYCTSSGNSTNEWIAGVEISGQLNTSEAGAYQDFTSQLFDLKSGGSESFVLIPGFSSRSKFEYWAIWIDFNQDFIFSDSERVFRSSKSKSAVRGSLEIPAGLNVTTRMRVVMSSTSAIACGNFAAGEVEDYSVRIYEPVPEADFTASSTSISSGDAVQFTNTSRYNPTSFQWSFPGGTPGTSTEEHPLVTFNTPGEYVVSLTVANQSGSSQKSMTISVSDQMDEESTYCIPENISSTRNYIQEIVFDGLSFTSAGKGYQLPESTIDQLYGGQSYEVNLIPYSNKTRNFWRIWIDYNMDGDFEDANEKVAEVNGVKGAVSRLVPIPENILGSTRMRIAMKVGKAPGVCESGFEGEVEDYLVVFDEPQIKAASVNPFNGADASINFKVYPNPTSDHITINLEKTEINDRYFIYDITGKEIVQDQLVSSITKVDLSAFNQGIYLLRVETASKVYSKKIIKND